MLDLAAGSERRAPPPGALSLLRVSPADRGRTGACLEGIQAVKSLLIAVAS